MFAHWFVIAFSLKPWPRLIAALLPLGAILFLGSCTGENPSSVPPTNSAASSRLNPHLAAQVAQLEARERSLNETVWAREKLAEQTGLMVEDFWDALNAATHKLPFAASFPIGKVILPRWERQQSLPHGIEVSEADSPGLTLTPEQWSERVHALAQAGWKLDNTEFRHSQFDVQTGGMPYQSRFAFSANLTNSLSLERATVEGDLIVDWADSETGRPMLIKQIDASHLRIKTRSGAPPFQLILKEEIIPRRHSRAIDPLILYDLDGDGHAEIILAAQNQLYRSADGLHYQAEPLCKYPAEVVYAGVIADFDGDGLADFLCQSLEGLLLFKGSARGTFDEPGRLAWAAPRDVKNVMVLSCGDIDEDGDLDVFLAQYKLPYDGGQMPTPYYNANDGYPAYLLLNDGHGLFKDGTALAGLGQKRWRRTFSASLVDLDQDGHLDLVVVSDFAGIDAYRNDGRGHFTDLTRRWFPESHAFGMGLAVADFNADGRLDLLMNGMPSASADRLEHLDAWWPGTSEDRTMRGRMTRGSRLFLAGANGRFEESALGTAVAHSGWAWGCSAFDFDNDGYPDLYVANGMETRDSVREYEGEFWLHDTHVATSMEDPAAYVYLKNKVARMRGHGESYGGYEKNHFYLNRGARSFFEAGHLFGIALEEDSRNVVAEDLDGDGRMDLIVTSYTLWPKTTQMLRVFRNEVADNGHWIGFQFREEKGCSPVGAEVTIQYDGKTAVRQIITGDSYRSQHSTTIHFGTGTVGRVDQVRIRWTTGQTLSFQNPTMNSVLRVSSSGLVELTGTDSNLPSETTAPRHD